jgi:hypothetical protein
VVQKILISSDNRQNELAALVSFLYCVFVLCYLLMKGKGQNYKNQNVESQKEHQKFEKDQNLESFH